MTEHFLIAFYCFAFCITSCTQFQFGNLANVVIDYSMTLFHFFNPCFPLELSSVVFFHEDIFFVVTNSFSKCMDSMQLRAQKDKQSILYANVTSATL